MASSSLETGVKRTMRRHVRHLLEAKAENLNEADTVRRISLVFEQVLGYDPLTEISSEVQLKNRYVDMAIKLDGRIRLLVEAKAADVVLRDRHIEQAQNYASRNNYQWVLLTSGVAWNLYHLTFDEGIEYERVFSVDLETDPLDKVSSALALLHRSCLRKGLLDAHWKKQAALGAGPIGRALFTQDVLRSVRRHIRRSTGVLMDVEDIGRALHDLLTPEAREHIGPFKIRSRTGRKKTAAKPVPVATASMPVGTIPS